MQSGKLQKVPPDGGYGWVVTFAYALNNVVVLPLIAGFGLVFQIAFKDTGLTATQSTVVVTLNHGIGMLLSFFGGPVLRRFGYRKVAVFGAILISSGLMLTAYASSFWLFLFSYGIVNSMGIASVMAAFSFAINSYFKEKRGRAIGVGMSITGLGAIYMPLVMSALIYSYGWRYAVLILGALCLHSLLAACLLRPVKWYLKTPPVKEEEQPLNDTGEKVINDVTANSTRPNAKPQIEGSKENGILPPKSLSMKSLTSAISPHLQISVSHPDVRGQVIDTPLIASRYKWWESQEFNLNSSFNIFHENDEFRKPEPEEKKPANVKNEQGTWKKLYKDFVEFFDLTLLSDPVFVNILFGLSMASCVEVNFSLLFPFILSDMFKFETDEIAKLMAIIGFSDTLFRFVSPFIGEWCNKSPRVMYAASLLIACFIRTVILCTNSFIGMAFVCLALGITKGVRTVYMNLVIPTYVPLERLPFASGIQMFFNGIIIITIGSLLGRLRESSGSYAIPIIVLNVTTLLTILSWSAEFLYFKLKKKDSDELDNTTA